MAARRNSSNGASSRRLRTSQSSAARGSSRAGQAASDAPSRSRKAASDPSRSRKAASGGSSRARSQGTSPSRTAQAPATGRSARRAGNTSAQAGTRRARATAVRGSAYPPAQAMSGSADRSGAGSAEAGGYYKSTSVEELRRADRRALGERKARRSSRRRIIAAASAAIALVAIVIGGVVLYNSPAFTISNIETEGVEHLTADEMSQLINVPQNTTLLRVDTDTIANRVKQSAWVQDVQVSRVFPDTLKVTVTERAVAAIVEIPVTSTSSVAKWAITQDHIWLMAIPEEGTEAAATTSSQIYEDEKTAMHIVDLPFGTKATIGEECTDGNVNNALDIVSGMTTELAGRVSEVHAANTSETLLVLDNGVEVAFGKAEDIRDKERVVLEILDSVSGVSYINVRIVEKATWRAI